MHRGCQGTWSELGRGKKEEDTLMAKVWWACTLGRKMLFQKHLQQLQHREGFSYGNGPKRHLSLLPEKVRKYWIPVPCPGPRWVSLSPGKVRHWPARGVSASWTCRGRGKMGQVCSTQCLHGGLAGVWGDVTQLLRTKPVCHSWINPACGHREVTGL